MARCNIGFLSLYGYMDVYHVVVRMAPTSLPAQQLFNLSSVLLSGSKYFSFPLPFFLLGHVRPIVGIVNDSCMKRL